MQISSDFFGNLLPELRSGEKKAMETSTQKSKLSFDERKEAVTRSVEKYHPYIVYYLTGLTKNPADAQDLASQLWAYVLRHFKDDQLESLTLFRKKSHQLFIDFYRKRKRARLELSEILPETGVKHFGKEAYTEEEELALKKRFWTEYPVNLSNRQREVLWLHARYGYTLWEITDITGIPKSSVADALQKSREAFARYLNRDI